MSLLRYVLGNRVSGSGSVVKGQAVRHSVCAGVSLLDRTGSSICSHFMLSRVGLYSMIWQCYSLEQPPSHSLQLWGCHLDRFRSHRSTVPVTLFVLKLSVSHQRAVWSFDNMRFIQGCVSRWGKTGLFLRCSTGCQIMLHVGIVACVNVRHTSQQQSNCCFSRYLQQYWF